MKLRNKKTGEIRNAEDVIIENLKKNGSTLNAISIDEIRNEWEDYEEPKEWWYIDIHGPHKVTNNDEYYQQVKAASNEIGNCFESKEEAEKAVEKLKVWKRLKDNGFKFVSWVDKTNPSGSDYVINIKAKFDGAGMSDLDLLFGGEE